MTDNRLTQEALEQWASGTPSVQLTQEAVEQWGGVSFASIQAVLTQIAIEQWAPPANGSGSGGGTIMPSSPTYGVPTPTGTLQGCAVFQWDGTTWQPSGLAAAGVGTPTGVLRGVAPFTWGGSAWTPSGGGPDVATAGGVLQGVAVYTWSGSAWVPAGGPDTATPTGVLQGVAAFNWDGTAWQPSGQAGPDVATPNGTLLGVAMFSWGGTGWAPTVSGVAVDINFVNTTSLDARVTFTRASTATYIDNTGTVRTAAVNAPRFDYDPATLASRGLLIEESRTNIWLQSADASNAAWSYAGSGPPVGPLVTANQTIAPDGTLTAASIAYPAVSGASAYSIAYQNLAVTAQQYTFSCWLKGSVGGEQIYLSVISALNGRVRCTLTTQWQRFTVTPALGGAGTGVFEIGCDLRDAGSTSIPACTVYVWGAQVEAGTFPTSYIPTGAATVTRAIDVANISPLGTWFNASTGSLAMEFDSVNGSCVVGGFSSGAFADCLYFGGGNVSAQVASTGTSAAGTSVLFTGVVQKEVARYATNNLAVCNNGGAVGVNAALGASPYAWTSNLCLGNAPWAINNNGTALDGHFRRVRFWPRALSNAEMQQVTT